MRRLGNFYIAIICALSVGSSASAAPVPLQLEHQPLAASLNSLSVLFNVQILYRQSNVYQIQAPPIAGNYEFRDAVFQLLTGTGLRMREVAAKTYVVEALPSRSKSVVALPDVADEALANSTAEYPDNVKSEPGLEEIFVSGYSVDANNHDLPIAVSQLDEHDLDRMFTGDIRELRVTAPNVIIDSGNANTSSMSVRGISLSDLEKSFDPAMGIMVDGIYLGSTSAALLSTFDLDKVEILRGPQGTVQGKNTTGGLIRLSHSRPTGEKGGFVAISAGSNSLYEVKGLLNARVVPDRLAAKMTFHRKIGGGFIYNTVTDTKEGDLNFSGYNLALLANLTDNLEIKYSYSFEDDDSDSTPFINSSPDESFQCQTFGECGRDFDRKRVNHSPELHPASFDVSLHILQFDYDSGQHEFTSVSGYRDLNEQITVDYDSAESQILLTERPATDATFSQEFRVHSAWSDGLSTVAGLFFWDREYSLFQTTRHLFELPFFAQGGHQFFTMLQETKAWSAYAQAEIAVGDKYSLTVGGRYIDEDKTALGTLSFIDQDGVSVSNTIDQLATMDGLPARRFEDSEDWSRFTPNIALSYFPADNMKIYAAFTEGFRSGGHNGRARSQVALAPYGPERVRNFEVGLQGDWFNRALLYKQTIFATKYKDKQEIFTAFIDDISAAQVVNASAATLWGIEFELQYQNEGFIITSSYGYLNSQYDEYEFVSAGGSLIDFSHNSLLLAPKNTFGLNVSYRKDSRWVEGLSLDYGFQASYRNKYQTSGDHPEHGIVDEYTLYNISMELALDDWRFSLYGKNLTNVYYRPYTNNVINGITGESLFSLSSVNAPRTWGVELRYHF